MAPHIYFLSLLVFVVLIGAGMLWYLQPRCNHNYGELTELLRSGRSDDRINKVVMVQYCKRCHVAHTLTFNA